MYLEYELLTGITSMFAHTQANSRITRKQMPTQILVKTGSILHKTTKHSLTTR